MAGGVKHDQLTHNSVAEMYARHYPNVPPEQRMPGTNVRGNEIVAVIHVEDAHRVAMLLEWLSSDQQMFEAAFKLNGYERMTAYEFAKGLRNLLGDYGVQ